MRVSSELSGASVSFGGILCSGSSLSEKEDDESGLAEAPVSLCVPALQADKVIITESITNSAVIRVFTRITPLCFFLASV